MKYEKDGGHFQVTFCCKKWRLNKVLLRDNISVLTFQYMPVSFKSTLIQKNNILGFSVER